MKWIKKIIYRILHPGAVLTVSLTLSCIMALVFVFVSNNQAAIVSYIVYTLTTYSLVLLIINSREITAKIEALVYKNKLAKRYMTDIPFQTKISLYTSLSLNLIYAIFKLTSGIYYASFWYGADAAYYIVLSSVRFLLLRHVRKDNHDMVKKFKEYRVYGFLIFALNVVLIVIVYQIVSQNMGFKYPGIMIYIVAAYAFYCIAISVKNVVKYRKSNDPMLSAHKVINLAKALVAMFALQTAMFASFNKTDSDELLAKIMNIIFGNFVCLIIFFMAVMMVIRANKELKTLDVKRAEK
ncbi:MAG: hypothetical protein FWD71_18055 [Oscillospiraceae bacterium]|nr:hypothetical protein [Oscillospiraceae bacterium]